MKKYGFTLQEILISLAIVGIVAAMTVPTIMGIMPDETKVKYMKAYNALTNVTNDLLSDSNIYWDEFNDAGDRTCIGRRNNPMTEPVGLNCLNSVDRNFITLLDANPEFESMLKRTTLPRSNNPIGNVDRNTLFNSWSNNSINVIKYPVLLASRMNLQTDPVCRNGVPIGSITCTFTTTDGTEWRINEDNVGNTFRTTVTVDVTPAGDGLNQTMEEAVSAGANTNNVDTFTFEVSNDGAVRATDALGRVFLRTPTDMHRKGEDRRNAAEAVQNNAPAEADS